jgi:hypothetical protein
MKKADDRLSIAARQYAEAYAAHYTDRDLLGALRSYVQVIALHPGTPEAGYARTQILGIVNQVVPAGELLDAQADLVVRHLQTDDDAAARADRP